MTLKNVNLAFDFGASSGRLIMGSFNGESIELEEIYRFSNEPVRAAGKYYWDFFRLFYELKEGLKKAALKDVNIESIGIDTWGVDYGLLDENDNLIGTPIHYRDSRTENVLKEIEKTISFKDIYKKTGIQYMPFNTIYQLYADMLGRNKIINNAKALLFMPDLFTYFLTGSKYNEYTISSTSQMINAKTKKWDKELLDMLNIPSELLQEIIMPGTISGYLTEDIQEEIGIGKIPVVAVGSHDTASAVAAAPLKDKHCAYLSCGTWSLLGIESEKPIIDENSLNNSFTNEGGVEDTIRFLKNIDGLWIIQGLKKSWCEHVEKIDFPDIIKAAREAKNKSFCIDPNNEIFMAPLNMAEAIKKYCNNCGQGTPETLGEIAMAAYNGLVREYKNTVENMEQVTDRQINTINMVGGGIKDELLCQLTANETGKRVVAGPTEASVLGNVMLQLIALGKIKDVSQGRKVVSNSFTQKIFNPEK